MNKTKRARFFCESCDTEVIGDAKSCPKCGRFFSSVRCPACAVTGEHFLFEHGCPACGYAMDGSPAAMGMTPKELQRAFKKDQAMENKKNLKGHLPHGTSCPTKKRNDDHLPAWVYIICMVLLIIALKVVYDFLR